MVPFKLKRRYVPILLGLLALLFSFWLAGTQNLGIREFLNRIEHLVYDLRLQTGLAFEQAEKPQIVIVDIDEKSLAQEGRWPWSRKKVGQLVESLFDKKALLVGFDLVFSEPERNAVDDLLSSLPAQNLLPPVIQAAIAPLKTYFDADMQLGNLLANKEIVLGFLLHNEGNSVGVLPFSPIMVPEGHLGTISKLTAYTGNVSQIQKEGVSGGFLTNFRDTDGVVRRSPLVLAYQQVVYPALSLEMARRYLLANEIQLNVVQEGKRLVVENVKIGPLEIGTDALGQVLVPYRGDAKTFTTLSAADVLSGHVNSKIFENSLVLIGTSALGLGDLVATPVSPVYPGVEVHASILAGILSQNFHLEPSWSHGAAWTLMALIGLSLVLLLPKLGPFMMLLVGLGTVLLLVILNVWLWVILHLALALAVPLISIFVILTTNLAYGFFVENRRKQELKTIFGQYVPPQHIEEMANEDNPRFGFEGEAREMSVLFADIRDFTALAEPLHATQLKAFLNDFLTPMTEIIFKYGGTIDKYVGDMVMAFWGAPLKDESHIKHAIAASLEMVEATHKISERFKEKGFPPIQIGIGINSGIMNVGDMGSTFRRSYTVLGDSVNLASRLEELTKYYGVPILVSEQTAYLQKSFIFRKIDKIRVRGKRQPIVIYQPLNLMDVINTHLESEIRLFEEALEHYFWGRWNDATDRFTQLQTQFGPQKLFSVYLERITRLSEAQGADWDGVYTMLSK